MIVSLLVYFGGLIMTEHWSKRKYDTKKRLPISVILGFVIFAATLILTEGISGYLTSLIMLAFVYLQLILIRMSDKLTAKRVSSRNDHSRVTQENINGE